jgi:nicotinamidase-related amidase
VVTKSLPNSFAGTNLHDLIQSTGRKELVFVGFATHMCLSATVRAALDLGYRSTVIAGATATRDLPGALNGSIVPAAQIQEVELSALADRFAVVVPDGSTFLARQPPGTHVV